MMASSSNYRQRLWRHEGEDKLQPQAEAKHKKQSGGIPIPGCTAFHPSRLTGDSQSTAPVNAMMFALPLAAHTITKEPGCSI